uniref:GP-PDE domain-containing protein n=1 Tax=Heterorhabditis bacteriophora TaxID=37862 RepID=A0A1I7WEM3_HETBA
MEQKIRGLHVAVWTVNDMAEMHWMLEYLDVPILTDHPYYTKKVLHLQNIMRNGYLP